MPLPTDRTIDGTNFMPIFSGQPLKRKVPLYWRNHLASLDIHIALRRGEWKILGSADLQQFQLYHIEKDWQEKNDLAQKNPEKLREMKDLLLAVHQQVEEEGPSEWWKGQPIGPRKPSKKK